MWEKSQNCHLTSFVSAVELLRAESLAWTRAVDGRCWRYLKSHRRWVEVHKEIGCNSQKFCCFLRVVPDQPGCTPIVFLESLFVRSIWPWGQAGKLCSGPCGMRRGTSFMCCVWRANHDSSLGNHPASQSKSELNAEPAYTRWNSSVFRPRWGTAQSVSFHE